MSTSIRSENNIQLAVYVSSFDGYSDLWDTFFDIFEKYWPDCPYKKYLTANELSYQRNDVEVLHAGPEKDWFTRTKKTLEMISEKYIIFFDEDYYISKKIDCHEINSIVAFMEKNDIYYYRLSLPSFRVSKKHKCIKVRESMNYPISMQLAIWNRKKLLDILKKIDGSSPWEFEYYFNTCFDWDSNKYIEGVRYDTRDLFGYKNGVLRGKWIPATVRYYKKQGIIIDTSKRGLLPLSIIIKWYVASFFSSKLNKRSRSAIKKILKKFNIKYL